jgi:hypothetical protein
VYELKTWGTLKKLISVFVTLVLLNLTNLSPANAQEFVRVSGVVTAPTGSTLENARISVNNGGYGATVNSDGSYEIVLPKDLELQFYFVTVIAETTKTQESLATFSNWGTKVKFSQNSTLNFALPATHKLTITFVDASNNPITSVGFGEPGLGNQPHGGTVQSGLNWTGIQRLGQISSNPALSGDTRPPTKTPRITANVFPTDIHAGFDFRIDLGPFAPFGTIAKSGPFPIRGDVNLKLCHPSNFGASLRLPDDCFVPAPAPTATPTPSVITPQPKAPTPIKYKNCAALQKVYKGGVAISSKSVNKGGKIKLSPTVNAKVYNLNKSLDRDKDGLACER